MSTGSGVHPLVERFQSGDVPAHLKVAAARGALPLPPEDLVRILFHLRREPKETQQEIVRTLEGMPVEPLLAVASDPATPEAMLDFLARASFRREPVLEKVLLNPSTSDTTFHLMAQHGSESILDLIALNQLRVTRSPRIIQLILENPRCTPTIRRRLKEIWDLHEAEAARATPAAAERPPAPPPVTVVAPPVPPPQPAAASVAPAPPAGTAAPTAAAVPAAAPPDDLAPEDLEALGELGELGTADLDARILEAMQEDDASEAELRLAQRLLTMTIPEKVQLAQKGSREARMVLIRDGARQVQEAVITSPKITENEIEKIANMRSVSDDVLRMIGNHREYTKGYAVCHALVRNPKTPQPSAIQLMQRLQNRDLTMLAKDKNIPDIIRRHALITLEKRQPKAGAQKKK